MRAWPDPTGKRILGEGKLGSDKRTVPAGTGTSGSDQRPAPMGMTTTASDRPAVAGAWASPNSTSDRFRRDGHDWFRSTTGLGGHGHDRIRLASGCGGMGMTGSNRQPVLQTNGLLCRFGGFVAIEAIDFALASGARHALIGPNGAGKTSLINLITGYLAPAAGRIELMGHDITRLPPHKRCQRGLVRTFQINQLFADMPVIEAVAMSVSEHCRLGSRWWSPLVNQAEVLDRAAAILHELHLLPHAFVRTRHLPYGRQRLLEIALALAQEPKVLLLDEPAAGVPVHDSQELFDTIAALPRKVSILLIEHDMNLVFRFAEKITVLVGGRILLEDCPQEVSRHPAVQQAYLGQAHA